MMAVGSKSPGALACCMALQRGVFTHSQLWQHLWRGHAMQQASLCIVVIQATVHGSRAVAPIRLPCWHLREVLGAGCAEACVSPLLLLLLLSAMSLKGLIIVSASIAAAGHIGLRGAQLVQVITDPYQLAGLCLPDRLANVIICQHGARRSVSLYSSQISVHWRC